MTVDLPSQELTMLWFFWSGPPPHVLCGNPYMSSEQHHDLFQYLELDLTI
jgi:hypothetical protein